MIRYNLRLMKMDMAMHQERSPELDSWRGIAALGVIGWHYCHHVLAYPMGWLMAPTYRAGWVAVDFFFVLSGFVLAGAYLKDDRRGRYFANVGDRIARIYPLQLATLLLVAGLNFVMMQAFGKGPVYEFNDLYHFVLNLLLLQFSGLQKGFSFNAVSWSISTEFIINLGFFALIAIPWRLIGNLLIFVAFVASTSIYFTQKHIWAVPYADSAPPEIARTAFGFLIGVYAYALNKRLARFGSSWIFDVVIVTLCFVIWQYLTRWHMDVTKNAILGGLLFPALLIATLHSVYIKKVLCLRPLVWIGTLSFSIYLLHFPVQLVFDIAGWYSGITLPYESPWMLITYLAVVICASSVSYRLIEVPGKAVLKKILRGQSNLAPSHQA